MDLSSSTPTPPPTLAATSSTSTNSITSSSSSSPSLSLQNAQLDSDEHIVPPATEAHASFARLELQLIPEVLNEEYSDRVSSLDLSHNKLSNLENLECFTRLVALDLSHNLVHGALALPASSSSSLTTLSLAHNAIATPQEFEALVQSIVPRVAPVLAHLDLSENPIFDESRYENPSLVQQHLSMYLVHHLPQLQTINGEELDSIARQRAAMFDGSLTSSSHVFEPKRIDADPNADTTTTTTTATTGGVGAVGVGTNSSTGMDIEQALEPIEVVEEKVERGNRQMEVPLQLWGKALIKGALGFGPDSSMTQSSGSGVDGSLAWKAASIRIELFTKDNERWLGDEEQILVRILAPLTLEEERELERMEALRAEIEAANKLEVRQQKEDELHEQVSQYGDLMKVVYRMPAVARVDDQLATREQVREALEARRVAHELEHQRALELGLPLPPALEQLKPFDMTRCGKVQETTIFNNRDGSFTVSFFPDRIGWYNVHIKLNGRRVPEAPFDVYMKRPILNLYSCRVDGIFVDELVSFQLDLEDPLVQMRPEHLQVRVLAPSSRRPLADVQSTFVKLEPPAAAAPKHSIIVRFTVPDAGEYEVDCFAFEHRVTGCPFPLFVTPKLIRIDHLDKGDDVDLPADLTFLRVGLGWTFPAGAKELDLDASCILLRYWMKEDHAYFNDLWTLDGSVRLSGDSRTGVSQEQLLKDQERARRKQEKADRKRGLPVHRKATYEEQQELQRQKLLESGRLPTAEQSDTLAMQLSAVPPDYTLADHEGSGDSESLDDHDDEFLLVDLHRVSRHITTLIFVVNVFDNGQTFQSVERAHVRLVDRMLNKVIYRYDLGQCATSAIIVLKIYRYGPSLWRLRIIDEPAHGHTFNLLCKKSILRPFMGPEEPPQRRYLAQVFRARLNPKYLQGSCGIVCRFIYDHCVTRSRIIPLANGKAKSLLCNADAIVYVL